MQIKTIGLSLKQVATLENLEIWDADMEVAILGLHDRAMKVHDIRVRMTWRQGFLVGKPIGHKAINVDGIGAADNKFSMLDVSDANKCGRNYAGIEVYASQCKFSQSTSWYNHGIRLENRCIQSRQEGSHITHMQVRLVQAGMLRQVVICLSDALLKKMGVMAG